MLGYQTPPRSRLPPRTRHTPLGADTPLGPGTPQEQTPPWSRHPQSRHTPGSRHNTKKAPLPHPTRHPPGADTLPRDQAPSPPQQTATVADGTHPTGKHSCCINVCTSLLHDVIHVKFMPNRINV